MSACTACSALALDEVARRRIGLPMFVERDASALVRRLFFPASKQVGAASPSPWVLVGGLVFAVAGRAGAAPSVPGERNAAVAGARRVDCRLCRGRRVDRHLDDSGRRRRYWRASTRFTAVLPPQNDAGACLLISESKVAVPAAVGAQIGLADGDGDAGPRLGPGAQDGPRRASEAEDGHRRRLEPRQFAARQPDRGPLGNRAGGQSAILRAAPATSLRAQERTQSFGRDGNCPERPTKVDPQRLRIGRSCRNSAHSLQFSHATIRFCEKEKFPVDAFGQKAYRPARNSTNQICNRRQPETDRSVLKKNQRHDPSLVDRSWSVTRLIARQFEPIAPGSDRSPLPPWDPSLPGFFY